MTLICLQLRHVTRNFETHGTFSSEDSSQHLERLSVIITYFDGLKWNKYTHLHQQDIFSLKCSVMTVSVESVAASHDTTVSQF